MKRKICILTAVLALSLTACSSGGARKAAQPYALGPEFERCAVMTVDGREYTAQLRRAEGETGPLWECAFTSPETVSGLKFTLAGEDCRLESNGLSYTTGRSGLPQYAAVPMLTDGLDMLISARDLTCTADGETLTERGVLQGLDLCAVIEGDKLTALTVGDELNVYFE